MSDDKQLSPVHVTLKRDRIVVMTKFFTWLAAALLSASVMLALITVSADRNALRDQIIQQDIELSCRAEAANELNKARSEHSIITANQNIMLGELVVFLSRDDPNAFNATVSELETVNKELHDAALRLEEAIAQQEISITECSLPG